MNNHTIHSGFMEMSEKQVRGIFMVANIPFSRIWAIQNQYWSSPESPCWWLVRTPLGLIEIGWRKRVISIDWSDTPIREDVVASSGITSSEVCCHAWSTVDAVTYLSRLAHHFSNDSET